MVDSGNWAYSSDHRQLCQVIDVQRLWRNDLPCLAARPRFRGSYPDVQTQALQRFGTGSPDDIAYISVARTHQFPVASKNPENILHEDSILFMWYDQ